MILHPNPYYDTEFQVLNCICDITRESDCYIIKSPAFPGYYDGNRIWVTSNKAFKIRELKDKFQKEFPSGEFNHIQISVENPTNPDRLISQAKKLRYEFSGRHVFMTAKTCFPAPLPPGIIIRELSTKKDWEEFYYHQKACHPNNLWFLTEGLEIQKITTQNLGICWFGVFEENHPQLLASLGVFQYGNMARLQDVKTNPTHFQKGFATHLMRFVIRYALETLKVRELVLCADKGYHAYQFYENLGFEPMAEIVVLNDF